MKPLISKIHLLLFLTSYISSEEIGTGDSVAVETILKENLNTNEKGAVETPDVDHIVQGSESFENVNDKIIPDLPHSEENVETKDYQNTEAVNDGTLLKESEGPALGLEKVAKQDSGHLADPPSTREILGSHEHPTEQHVQIDSQFKHNNPSLGYEEVDQGNYAHPGQEYQANPEHHTGHPHSPHDHHSHHGHSHGDFAHSHDHQDPYQQGQGHGHQEHSHEMGQDHNSHSHSHGHGHGHSHDHGHGHGHSHDHGDDHDHSHGIGHLGKAVHKKVPEETPQHYKPAAQDYELPLSARFGTPSPYNYQPSEPSSYSTEPPAAYEDYSANLEKDVGNDQYEKTTTGMNGVQENYNQGESYSTEARTGSEDIPMVYSYENIGTPEVVAENTLDIQTNLNKDQNQGGISADSITPKEEEMQLHQHIHSNNNEQPQSLNIIPDRLQEQAQENGGFNSDRIALIVIISVTILVIYLINTFMDQSTRERPLIRRLAEMDRKLFKTTNELLILQSEKSESGGSSGNNEESMEDIRELELELQQARLELETSRETVKKEGERSNMSNIQLEEAQQDVLNAQEEARQAQEMVEEMLANQKDQNGGSDDKLMEVVHQLQSQLESQKDMLLKYEPKLKKKEKENKELTKQMKQMRADVANANLDSDKLKSELSELSKVKEDSTKKLEEIGNNELEWKSLSDLLQTQLDEKTEEYINIETEMSSLSSRLTVFKNESESKEEQMEILQETIKELKKRKMASEEEDGWEVEGEGWNDKEVDEVKDVAILKIENRKIVEEKQTISNELCQLKEMFNETSGQLNEFKSEAESLREGRDEVVKENNEVQRKLDVLTEFFNKKEAELQKQLGLQSARFGDANTDAESTARKLISLTSELESTQDQLRILKGELDDQERSLKSSVAGEEKKAHENWVAARQAERKLTELQAEMSILRNRLTIVESKNTLLEQEKGDLEGTVATLKDNVKPEPGPKPKNVSFAPDTTDPDSDSEFEYGQSSNAFNLRGSESVENLTKETFASGLKSPTSPQTLPPLPGLPGMPSAMTGMSLLTSPLAMAPSLFQAGPMLPGMLDIRPPPLGRMSPGPRDRNRSFTSRSPSPDNNSYRGSRRYNRDGRDHREASPSSRSERRLSPVQRGPSPTRSERGYRDHRDRQYEGDYSRDRDRDRHYNGRNREASPDRYSDRSQYSVREGQKYRQDRPEKK